jgi:hypothetical protein
MSKKDPLYHRLDENGKEIEEEQVDQDTQAKLDLIARCRNSAGVDDRFMGIFGNLKPLNGGK